MISLPHGCAASELTVHPANWNTKGAKVDCIWHINYRFYDPVNCPKGHPVRIKSGLNRLDTLADKRSFALSMISREKNALLYEGYNPFLKVSIPPTNNAVTIEPTTPFIQALNEAHKRLKVAKRTYDDLTAVIRTINKAAVLLNINYTPVSEVKRKHIKLLLEQVGKLSKSWSAHNYNKYRSYLMILYKELLEHEAIEANIIKDISTQKKVKKIRQTLTRKERVFIDWYLKENYYRFWLFVNIFFDSGARISEMVLLKGSGVDLSVQKFKVMVLKGVEYREVQHTISNLVLPFWNEVMKDCLPGQFVFSEGLRPGDKAIRSDQITKRWYRLLKQKELIDKDGEHMKITADFYSLKHSATTEIVTSLGPEDAAKHNGQTSTDMVAKVYDINSEERRHERMKRRNNKLA